MTGTAGGPLTHAFLFADLRGYTAFVEGHGDRAAADLLDRYRSLVRTVIDASAGAEIRTEGDSFYVVFPSASAAVGAGLAIATAAAEASEADPSKPIRVGVGVHAGEAEERPDGLVGGAVNVAARVCAKAVAGEVLVTETVRSLVRTGGRYTFVARGSHRLKGVAEPVVLYRAEVAPASSEVGASSTARGSRRRSTVVAGSAILVAVLVLGGLAIAVEALSRPGSGAGPMASLGLGPGSGSIAARSPAASVDSFHGGRIRPGTYVTTVFFPTLRLTFTNDSWNGERETPNDLRLGPGDEGVSQLGIFRPLLGYAGCSAETTTIGPHVQDVVAYLRGHPALASQPEQPARLGAFDTVMVEFRVRQGCATNNGAVPLFRQTDGGEILDSGLVASPGYVDQVYLTELNGQVLAVWIAAPASLWDRFQPSARSLLTSLEPAR